MDYKKLMGYGDTKKITKKVSKPKKNRVLEGIKKNLNEWNDRTFKNAPKRWSKEFGGSGLTEHETLKEGPSYEYGKSLKAIEKAENLQAKAVNNFVKILKKKGFPKEATNVASMYMVQMRKFDEYMKELADKLL